MPDATRPAWPARPAGSCLLCPRPRWHRMVWNWPAADRGYRTCNPCCERLREQLAELGRRYQRLDPTPAAGDGTRAGSGRRSSSPANDHVIVMTDPRSKSCEVARDGVVYVWDPRADLYIVRFVWFGADGKVYREEPAPARSVPQTLGFWVADLPDGGGQTRRLVRTVAEQVRWIDRRLDWLTRQEQIADFAADVRALLAQLRAVTGDPRVRIGRCPNTLDDGAHTRECGAVLTAPLHGDTVRCQACGRSWPRVKWVELGELLGVS